MRFDDGSTIDAHAVILATGVAYRQLGRRPALRPSCTGRGVYYGAAVSDASECAGEDVYIVGGANSAGQAAMFMSRKAKSVTMLVRGPSLEASMSYYLIQQIEQNPNITVRTCTEVVDTVGRRPPGAAGPGRQRRPASTKTVAARRMCCFIGATPRTDWLDGVLARDDHGFILTGPDLQQRLRAGRWTGRRTTWKQVCPVCLLQATCAPNPPSGSRPPSAKDRWP